MKKLLIMAAFVLSSIGAFAQYSGGEITIQPKVGLNVTNLTNSEGDWKAGLAAGAEIEYHVTPMLGLSGGLIYSMQGTKDDETKMNLDYLNIPIMANVYVAPGLALKAGLQPAINLSAKVKQGGVSVDLDGIESFDFSIPVGISYEYSNLVFDARYNIGLTKIADGLNSKNQVLQITVGYKFAL